MVTPHFELKDASLVLGEKTILQHVSLRINNHCLTQIQGKNGSGKTCLIACLLGLYRVKSGEQIVRYDKKRICYIPAHICFFEPESVATVLFFLGKLYGQGIQEGCQRIGLNDSQLKKKKIAALSSGMKQKLHILPLFTDNDVYFLDEISHNLDQATREIVIERINQLQDQGKTIVIVDHNEAFVMRLHGRKEIIQCQNNTATVHSYSQDLPLLDPLPCP